MNQLPIDVQTSNAPISLNLTTPGRTGGDAVLPISVSTRTTYAPSVVSLPDTFAGDFNLMQWGGWQQPLVHFDREHEPAGRTMRISGLSDRSVSGDVRFGDAPPQPGQLWLPKGRVSMQATNGDIDLYL